MNEQAVRNAVLGCVDGGQAYMSFDDAVRDFPPEHYNTKPNNVPYTFWHLLEHIRICIVDILEYIENPDYKEMDWPREFWPEADAIADEVIWNETIGAIRNDMSKLRALVIDPDADLTGKVVNAGERENHTLIREVLVVTDHNAYHLGEFAILRQVMGLWPAGHN